MPRFGKGGRGVGRRGRRGRFGRKDDDDESDTSSAFDIIDNLDLDCPRLSLALNALVAVCGVTLLAIVFLFWWKSSLFIGSYKIEQTVKEFLSESIYHETADKFPDEVNIGKVFLSPSMMIGATGMAIAAIGCAGCFISISDSQWVLNIYESIFTEVILMQSAVVGLFVSTMLDEEIQKYLQDEFQGNFNATNGTDPYNVFFNGIMLQQQCCGILSNILDFDKMEKWNEGEGKTAYVPLTCCNSSKPSRHSHSLPCGNRSEPIDRARIFPGCWKTYFEPHMDPLRWRALCACVPVLLLQAVAYVITVHCIDR